MPCSFESVTPKELRIWQYDSLGKDQVGDLASVSTIRFFKGSPPVSLLCNIENTSDSYGLQLSG